MVKKYYVIIVGVDPGVYFDNWVEVAPLVKNHPSSIYQKVETEEEAWRLFENASLKGQVRALSFPPGSTASPGSQTTSTRKSPSSSVSNAHHSSPTPASKLTRSRSETQARNGASPGRFNLRDPNTVSAAGRTTTSLNRVITVSKTLSEPNPTVSAFDSLKKVYVQQHTASNGIEASSNVDVPNTQMRTRVESPPWLASYPDDEIESSISPAFGPIASPVNSSRSFEPCSPVPFSTPRHDREAVEHTGYDSSEPVKSPTPSFRRREVRGSRNRGIDQTTESKLNAASGGLSKNSRCNGEVPKFQGDVDPFVQLVVDEVLKRLRPSLRVEDELLPDSSSKRPSRPNGHNSNARSERQNGRKEVSSPGSHSQRSAPSPTSGAKGLLSPGAPNGSVLFHRSRDNSGSFRNGPLKRNGLCQQCNGTGYDVGVAASVLDEAGLNQPNLAPFQPYDTVQDPRSPLITGLKKLASPFTFRRPSPIVSKNLSANTSF
ncbi:hypothetical protein Agabi119p4_2504 [Agaricus bisporus var. burnettii]|uniref:Ribonuclease H1 N-terminal domain-containing protein n=1 Tax=Agaricus bisporus var. burnettii TaxID=192524 RepID=A0A8H7F9B3_AGABI|nr:hypothetical protein Agabi119p4_2504 [Agaricus bisporus var. burnettii]